MDQEARDKLLEVYRYIVSDKVSKAERGISPNHLNFYTAEGTSVNDLEHLTIREAYGMPKHVGLHAKIETGKLVMEARHEILLGELYDKLKELDEQGIQLEEIAKNVRDPLLDGAFIFLEGQDMLKGDGLLESSSRNEFVEGVEGELYLGRLVLGSYIRPLMLLELIKKHPEKIPELDENSGYFSHKFFGPEKKHTTTIKELYADIAHALPSLFSDELVELISGIEQFYEDVEGRSGGQEFSNGKYRLSNNGNKVWKKGKEVEQGLDDLYNKPEVKRQIYETFTRCIMMINTLAKENGRAGKDLSGGKSEFGLTPKEYERYMDTANAYATNQLFYAWKDGNFIQETKLSRLIGVKVTDMGDKFKIENKFYKRMGVVTLTEKSRGLNSTRYLPFCVAKLNDFYQAAMEIQQEQKDA